MTAQDPPTPQRRRVTIVSAGITDRPTYTRHVFVEAVLAPDPAIDAGGGGREWLHPQWDLMFQCEETGARRKYGVVDATTITERNQNTERKSIL